MYQLENHFNHCAAEWTLPVPEAWETAFLRADEAVLASPVKHFSLGDWEFEAVTGDEPIDLSDLALASEPAKVAFISADVDGRDPLLDVLRADGVEIIRITAGRDGEQISNYLFTHDHIDSIHIIAGQPDSCRVEQRDTTALTFSLIAPGCDFYYSAIVEFSEFHFSQIFSVAALPLTAPSSVVLEDGAVILFDEHANAVHCLSFSINCLPPGDAVELATTVKYRYFTPDGAVNRLDVSLLTGHAGLGNDGHCSDAQFLYTNAIDGKISLDGVSFYKSETRNPKSETSTKFKTNSKSEKQNNFGKCQKFQGIKH